jgi:hypothetical protein
LSPDEQEDKGIEVESSSALKMGEVEQEEEKEIEVEVVDDTPKADRGRKASKPPEDLTDDELEDYSDKVRKRIQHFSKGYHDERRAKEASQTSRNGSVCQDTC